MNGKATIFLGLMLALGAMPAVDATHPSTACDNTQAIHSYAAFAGIYAGFTSTAAGSDETGISATTVNDSCDQDFDSDGIPDYDGDTEIGIAGARFAAGTNGEANGCYTDGVTAIWDERAHHGYGAGVQYWADDETGIASIVYSIGADGPAIIPDPTDPCATDGIISNDPTTDPADCGAGATGMYAPPTWTPATAGETVAGNGACNPFDGFMWMFITSGIYIDADSGNAIASTPISGHAWN